MVAILIPGQRRWSVGRDDEGHREYRIVHRVRASTIDGPQVVLLTPGLPLVGSPWAFDNDFDPWAMCFPFMRIETEVRDEPNTIWRVEQKFSTKPLFRCQDIPIEDPLLEPADISGSFVKYTKEVTEDKDGNKIKSSSHEMIRGPQVEFDFNRSSVTISQNVSLLELDVFTPMVDTVNDAVLWGLGARQIKLSNVSWERKVLGSCGFYYTRSLEFDIDATTFDRNIVDEGTKVLSGHWEEAGWTLDNIDGGAPDKTNPQHFNRYKDRNDENSRVMLDGNGEPLAVGATPIEIPLDYYGESNFLLLGIPTTL